MSSFFEWAALLLLLKREPRKGMLGMERRRAVRLRRVVVVVVVVVGVGKRRIQRAVRLV